MTAVLAQTESVANWISAIGGLAGAIGTITVAIIAYRWDRRRHMAESRERETVQRAVQRDREAAQAAQARLVTIAVDYRTPALATVSIANYSKNPVFLPQIESMGQCGARSGHQGLVDDDGEEYWLPPPPVLLPGEEQHVPFQHLDADGRLVNLAAAFMANTIDRYTARVDDVTITFDIFDVRWSRTGNRDPVRLGSRREDVTAVRRSTATQ